MGSEMCIRDSVFFVCIILFRVAAAVYFLTHLLVAAAPVVMLARRVTISELTAHASRRVVQRFEEAKSLLRKTVPVARRVLGESHEITLRMRWMYAEPLYEDPSATLDDLRKAVTMLEETAPTARRVLGSAHPLAMSIERSLRDARVALRARETPSPGSNC